MPLNRGRLRHRVTIRRLVEQPTGLGGYLIVPTDIATVAAEVIGMDGRESVMEKVLQGISVYRITIGWRGDVLQSDQLRYGAQDLNIHSAVDPDGRRERLVIIADNQSTVGS